jgi:hypothetical protein
MRNWRGSAWTPWTGLFVGAAAWFAQHQAGSDVNFWDCRTGDGAFVVAVGVACTFATAAGGWVSWQAARPPEADLAQNRGFARIVGALGAAIFLLAIAFQTLAGVLVPACHR